MEMDVEAKTPHERAQCQTVWSRRMGFSFNALNVGPIFDSSTDKIIFGTVKGKIRIFDTNMDQEDTVLETKGGSVQALLLHDVTKFGTTASLDLIVADADGNLIIFSNREILQRSSVVAFPITALAASLDILNNFTLIAGDAEGHLTAFKRDHEVIWKIKVGEGSIRAAHAVKIKDNFGNLASYLLVAHSSSDSLLFYSQDQLVKRVPVGALINTICVGHFTRGEGDDPSTQQIAVGCENGWIYLIQNYRVEKYAQVGHCITKLQPFKLPGTKDTTALICCGHFNSLKIYHDGQMIEEVPTDDWVHTLAVGDVDNDGADEIVAGQLNDQVVCLRPQFKQ